MSVHFQCVSADAEAHVRPCMKQGSPHSFQNIVRLRLEKSKYITVPYEHFVHMKTMDFVFSRRQHIQYVIVGK